MTKDTFLKIAMTDCSIRLPDGNGDYDEEVTIYSLSNFYDELTKYGDVLLSEPKNPEFEKYRASTVCYNGFDCLVVQVPHSFINYFELRPIKYQSDIGGGAGNSIRVTKEIFLKSQLSD